MAENVKFAYFLNGILSHDNSHNGRQIGTKCNFVVMFYEEIIDHFADILHGYSKQFPLCLRDSKNCAKAVSKKLHNFSITMSTTYFQQEISIKCHKYNIILCFVSSSPVFSTGVSFYR